MLKIETAAREVVKNWEKGDLAGAVRELSKALTEIDEARTKHAAAIAVARQQCNDELEIDDVPLLSVSENGVFVGAWVYVPNQKAVDSEPPRIVETPGLQWLVLSDEGRTTYTNHGDGREGDASELVAKVNSDQALGLGHSDWRLPTKDELEAHIGTEHAPKEGYYWSSSPYVGVSDGAWGVYFYYGGVGNSSRSGSNHVRLVRASQ